MPACAPSFWIEINTDALRANLAAVRSVLSPNTGILAVVKDDAYGHGLQQVVSCLQAADVTNFAVASPAEALKVLAVADKATVVVLNDIADLACDEALSAGVHFVVTQDMSIDYLLCRARALGTKAILHVKIDTGMSRLGFHPSQLLDICRQLRASPSCNLAGIMSHLPDFGTPDAERQVSFFGSCIAELLQSGLAPSMIHLCNSGGLFSHPQGHHRFVRPGISLYGGFASLGASPPLQPVLSLKARIMALRDIPTGATVGYGRTFKAVAPSRIATIPIGYGLGYPRRLISFGKALVRGQLVPLAGVVCMDMLMLDVTSVGQVALGDEVVLLGTQGSRQISYADLCQASGLIPYEIMTGLSRTIPRLAVQAD